MPAEKKINGVDVDQLMQTIDKIKQQPDLAKFKFRTTNRWMGGTHNRATVQNFYGAGQEDTGREPLMFDLDEPPVLLGENRGANPVEYLLVALSGCLTTSLVAYASAKGIKLNGVSSRFEGTLDLRGFLGIADDVKVEYEQITVLFRIDGNISDAIKEELILMAQKYSPVFNSITKPVQVRVQLDSE